MPVPICRFKFGITTAFFALILQADTIELKSGDHIEGTFKQATSSGVVILIGGQPFTIPLGKVRTIYLGAAPKAAEPPVKPASPSHDALFSLKALQSVATSGISYLQYTPRVLDARVKVDEYLASPGTDSEEIRESIRVAMREFELASEAWKASIEDNILEKAVVATEMDNEPAVAGCGDVQAARATKTLLDGTVQVHVLWKCAVTKIAEADKLLSTESGTPRSAGTVATSVPSATRESGSLKDNGSSRRVPDAKPHIIGLDPR